MGRHGDLRGAIERPETLRDRRHEVAEGRAARGAAGTAGAVVGPKASSTVWNSIELQAAARCLLILSVGPAATVPAASELHTKASSLYFLNGTHPN